jgi:hypothetical protein
MNGNSYTHCVTSQTVQFSSVNLDELVKSRNMHNFVIPVKTGIQQLQIVISVFSVRSVVNRIFYEFINLEPVTFF